MSNKRSLQMFQQGSPKRRKPFSPQGPDVVQEHHKYPITRNSYPTAATQQFNHQPYQIQNFQHDNSQHRNFYEIPNNVNYQQKYSHGSFSDIQQGHGNHHSNHQMHGNLHSNQQVHENHHSNQLGQGVFGRPTNNFGYNPGQTISLQNKQKIKNQNFSQSTMVNNGSANVGRTNQYDAINRNGIAPRQTFSYENSPQLLEQTHSMHRNQPNYPGPGLTAQPPPQSYCSSFENKSALYKMNHSDPSQMWSERHVTNQHGHVTAEPYMNSFNQLQHDPRYQAPDGIQQPMSNQQNGQLTSNIQYYQQNLSSASASSLGCSGSRPPTTGHGNPPLNRFEFNKNGQTFPTTQYKIGPAQRHLPPSKTDNLNKPESKSGDKRKSTDAGKMNSGRKRIVTCNVSAMLHWAKLTHSSQFLFEIFGCLNSSERMNDVSYKLQLKDSENNLLEANYYLSSTTQPELITGRYYRVIGKMINKTFLCFKLKEVPYMETRNAVSLIKQSEIAMSKLILQINEN